MKKRGIGGRLARAFLATAGALLVLAVLARASMALWLPWAVERAGRSQGLALAYEDLDLALTGGALELWHLDVALDGAAASARAGAAEPAPARAEGTAPASAASGAREGQRLAHLEYLALDVDVSALFFGRLRVHRAEVDGLDVFLERDAAGVWNFAPLLARGAEPEPPDEPEDDGEDEPIELGSPVEVRALRLQHLRVHVADRAVSPPVETALELSLRVSDIGAPERETQLGLLASGDALDALRFDLRAASSGPRADATWTFELAGLHARQLAPWLAELGLTAQAEDIDCAFAGGLAVAPTDASGLAVAARAELKDLVLSADGASEFSVASVVVEAPRASAHALELGPSGVRGVRGRAARAADGGWTAAGFTWLPGAATARPSAERAPAESAAHGATDPAAPEAAGVAAAAPAPFELFVERLGCDDVLLEVSDHRIEPSAHFELALAEIFARGVRFDPDLPDAELEFGLRASSPGMFESLTVAGRAVPFAPERSFALDLALTGIAPERARPYLEAAGLTSAFAQGELRAHAAGRLALDDERALISAELSDVALSDGAELASLARVDLKGLELERSSGDARLADLEIRGARLALRRDREGALHAGGLFAREIARVSAALSGGPAQRAPAQAAGPDEPAPEAPAASDESEPAQGPEEAAAREPARLSIGRVAWLDTHVEWRDEALDEPVEFALAELAFELEGLELGGAPGDPEAEPARVRLSLASALCDSLEVAGSLRSRPGPLDVELDVELAGRGLRLTPLAAYMAELGVESALQDGALDASLSASARHAGPALELGLALREVALTSAGTEWLALEELAVPRAQSLPAAPGFGGSLEVDRVSVRGPALVVRRDEAGRIVFLDTAFGPRPASAAPPTRAGGSAGPEESAQPTPGEARAAAPFAFGLGRLEIEAARVAWEDPSVAPPLATELALGLALEGLALGRPAPPARLELRVSASDVLGELALESAFTTDPADLTASASFALAGLRGEPLAGYLPEGTRLVLEDGRARFALSASSRARAEGGRSLEVELRELDWREGTEGPALLALERAALRAPVLDAAGRRFEIAELALEGLELGAEREQGGFAALGFHVAAPAQAGGVEPGAEAAQVSGAIADSPPAQAEQAPEPVPASAAAGLVGRADSVPPTVQLERLSLGVERFTFQDRTHAEAVPLELAFALTLPEPTTLLAGEPESLAPLRLELAGRAAPIVGAFELALDVSPWIAEPEFDLRLAVREITGRGITEVLPALAAVIDASELDGGRLDLGLAGVLRMRRRGPLDFDLAQGFGVEATLAPLAFRATPEGAPLFAVEAVDVEVARVHPDSGEVHVKSFDVVAPSGRAWRDARGLHALGITLLAAPAQDGALSEEPAAGVPASALASAEPASAPRSGVLAVDRLSVGGIDFEYRDSSVDPPFVLPLADLDVEVRGFDTRAASEPLPLTFAVSLGAGPVELPKRRSGGLLSGVFGELTGQAQLGSEQRPLFDEVAVAGRVVLAPEPKGWLKLDLRALELTGLRGLAAQAGVEIGDGVVDSEVEVRLRGPRGLSTETKTTFGYLSVSEPAGGPISRILQLPAPLDTVLFVLKDESGEHVIPLSVAVGADGLSAGALAAAVAKTLGQIIADAISASPFRIVGGVLDLASLGAEEPVEPSQATRGVIFEPGATTFTPAAYAELAPLIELLEAQPAAGLVLQYEPGLDDWNQAERLANPTTEQSLALAAGLRARKRALEERRAALAADAALDLALGSRAASALRAEQLRELERELGTCERALDELLVLLRPGAERRRDKRTQAVCRALAELRLEAVRAALLREPIARMPARVDVRRARIEGRPEAAASAVQVTPRARP